MALKLNSVTAIREKYRRIRLLMVTSTLAGSIAIAAILLWKAQSSPQEVRGGLLMAAGIILAMLPVDLALIWYVTGIGLDRAVRLARCLEDKFGAVATGLRFGMLSYRWSNNTITIVVARPGNGLYVARVEQLGPITGSQGPRLMWDLFVVPLGIAARRAISPRKCKIYSWEREGAFTVPLSNGQWARIDGKARVAEVECLPRGANACIVLDELLALVS